MKNNLIFLSKILVIIVLLNFNSYKVYSEESEENETILQQIQNLQKDIKTLEKAVYSQPSSGTNKVNDLPSNSGDVLTQHLLKLSELEEQFKILTNNFEEINFKLDKLSNRITKVQTDNQMRFQDLEKSNLYEIDKIYWAIEDCKKYGTLPFAGLARCGFIAMELLNSLVIKSASNKLLVFSLIDKVSFKLIFFSF